MKITVGVADMKISTDAKTRLATYSLGSCIGITIYDPLARVGGMLHYLMPESRFDREKAVENPFRYADTGIPALFKEAYKKGAQKDRIRVVVAGGACTRGGSGVFKVGELNQQAARRILARNRIKPGYIDLGGNVSRTVTLDIGTGNVTISSLICQY